jgi:SNF2 family DNA or RNA helicase
VSTPLLPHQERVVQKARKTDGLLVYHGMGSGKTLTALSVARDQNRPLVTVGPASLKANFPDQAKKFKIPTPVTSYSYNKPPVEVPSKAVVAFDEVHNLGRSDSQRSKLLDRWKENPKLLLTGTPVRNHPSEIVPIMKGLGIYGIQNERDFKKKFIVTEKVRPGIFGRLRGAEAGVREKLVNKPTLQRLFKGKVDYHNATGGLPTVKEETIRVPLTDAQDAANRILSKGYADVAYKVKWGIPPGKQDVGRMNSFLNASRQVANTPENFILKKQKGPLSHKLQRLADDIHKDSQADQAYRGMTYSNYIGSGVTPLSRELTARGVSNAVLTGKVSPKDRQKMIQDYNSGKVRQLLISSAGSEGLNLKGTKVVSLMEPHWNLARTDQAAARGIRLDSHTDLPEDLRNVTVRRYITQRPRKFYHLGKKPLTVDEYIGKLSVDKQRLNNELLDILKKEGS